MEYLSEFLPIIIYILLVILITLLIVISIKIIKALNKVQLVVDDVDKKVKTLDGFFGVLDKATDKMSIFSERLINIIIGIVDKIKIKRKKVDEKEND